MVPLDFDSVKADMTLFLMFFVDVDIIKNKLKLAMIIAIYNKRKKHKTMRIRKKKRRELIIFGVGCVYVLTMWRYQNWTSIILLVVR